LSVVNTFLSSLDGINLNTADNITISDNTRLTTFSTQVANVTSSIDIDNNGQSLTVEFPNLEWAGNLNLRNVSSISIPSLAVINGSLGFYGSYFTSIYAPNLTTVGNFASRSGGITIDDNESLTNITMNGLSVVGGLFQIADDPAVHALSFPELTKIGGALDLTGNFTTPLLPKIAQIAGAVNVQSEQVIDCSTFTKYKGSVSTSTPTCKSGTSSTTTTTGGSSKTSGSASSSSSSAAAVPFGVNEGFLGLSVLGGLLSALL